MKNPEPVPVSVPRGHELFEDIRASLDTPGHRPKQLPPPEYHPTHGPSITKIALRSHVAEEEIARKEWD